VDKKNIVNYILALIISIFLVESTIVGDARSERANAAMSKESASAAGHKTYAVSPAVKPKTLSSDDIRNIQFALFKAGFNPGRVNGRTGKRTRRAIRSFQKSKGLPITGIVDDKTWKGLYEYFPNTGNQNERS